MISLSKNNDNLVLTTDLSTLNGTEVYVNNKLRFTVASDGSAEGLISDVLDGGVDETSTVDYVVAKYGGHLFLVNRKALDANYGEFFQAGLDESKIIWYIKNSSTGVLTQVGTGYYYIPNGGAEVLPYSGLYAKLILKEDGYFYVNAYIVQ